MKIPSNIPGVLEALKRVGAPAPLVEVFERQEAKREEILGQRFNERKTEELIAAAEDAARAEFRERVASMTQEITARFDQEANQVRGAAREDLTIPVAETQGELQRREIFLLNRTRRVLQISTDVALIRELADAAAVRDFVEAALITEDDYTVSRIGLAAEQRLAALEAADRQEHTRRHPGRRPGAVLGIADYVSPITAVRAEVTRQLQAWRAEHPAPAERLRAIERQRSAALFEVERGADLIRDHLGLESVATKIRQHQRA